MHTAVAASHLGKLIDSRYRLQRFVGEGASSWVFAATDERLEREVALKLFKPPSSEDDAKRRRRCIAEGRTLAKLVHPHIVAIHDAGEDDSGHSYLVVELCEAGTLEAELAQRERLELLETLRLLVPLMGALAFAHDRNIVHRDIKPGNIVLVEEHAERRCKLLDFGISLGAGVWTNSELTLGTPAYMAPEQVRGEPTTPATDVWALGIVLFQCLTGTLPFQATNSAGVLIKIVQERAPRLGSVCDPRLAPNVMRVIDRALEPHLDRRYRDVRSMARALAGACALDGLESVRRPDPIGLPDFDSWMQATKTTQETEELPIAVSALSASPSPERRRPRWALRLSVAAVFTGILATGVLSSMDTGPTQASDAAPRAARPDAERVATQAPKPAVPASPPPLAAQAPRAVEPLPDGPPPPSEPVTAPLPAESGSQASKDPLKNVKPKKDGARRARAQGPATPSPRVITSWDW